MLEFTDEEFMYVCKFFDRDLNAAIEGDEFLVGFQLLSNAAKRRTKDLAKITKLNKAKREAFLDRKRDEMEQKQLLKDLTFTDADVESLWEKMKDMAQMFVVDPSGYIDQLHALKPLVFDQRAFISTMFRIFPSIRFTIAEIAVLMTHLDEYAAYHLVVHGEKFLVTFYKLARKEEQILTGTLDEDAVSLKNVILPQEVHTSAIKKRQTNMEELLDNIPTHLVERLQILTGLHDK